MTIDEIRAHGSPTFGDLIDGWLDTPHPQLGGRTPAAAVADGDGQAVVDLINMIENGVTF